MNLRMRQRQPGGAGVIKGRLGSIGNHPGAIISNNCDFCNCYGQKSYGPGYTNKVPTRGKLKPEFGDSKTQRRTTRPTSALFLRPAIFDGRWCGETFGSAGSFVPVRQPRITRHPNRLATVSGGSEIHKGAVPMKTPSKGTTPEIRPNSTPTLPQITALVRDCGFLAGELNRLANDAERLSIVCPGDDRIGDIARWADDAYILILSAYRAACSLQVSAGASEAGSQGGEQ
jgi:hypothetical protein